MTETAELPAELQSLDKATFDRWFDERYAEKSKQEEENSKGRLALKGTVHIRIG